MSAWTPIARNTHALRLAATRLIDALEAATSEPADTLPVDGE